MAIARASESGILRLYRGCLALYPAEFREEYGRELCLVFVDRWQSESCIARGWLGGNGSPSWSPCRKEHGARIG